VYDMYPWDSAGPAGRTPKPSGTSRSREGSPPPRVSRAAQAVQAVQAALDRRDNGGDAAAPVEAVSTTMTGPPRQ
jgi:hypothetical protein